MVWKTEATELLQQLNHCEINTCKTIRSVKHVKRPYNWFAVYHEKNISHWSSEIFTDEMYVMESSYMF